ncbi:MAG: SulP family sulfate permease, partial [Saprospiraceae bacterium]
SGATGAVAIVLVVLAKSHGIEYILATVILAGILQTGAGLLKLGKFIRLVPMPVIFGFVNGLAVIIFKSQRPQFEDAAGNWLTGSSLYIMLGLVSLTVLIIWGLPKITKAVPAALVAILVVFGVVTLFPGLETKTIGDVASIAGKFPDFSIPSVPFTLETLKLIFPYAAIMAGVGLIESLLTLNIIDELTETRGNSNRETIAQGAGNILAGLFGGMGGCVTIGQSLVNISSGARARLSGIFASLMLLVFIMYGSSIIEQIPMAALTGVMIMIAATTFEWASLKTLTKMPKSDVIIMVIVTLVTAIAHNIALAVGIGVISAALVFAWDNAKRIRARKNINEQGIKTYEMYGPLFFGSVNAFTEKFDVLNDPKHVIIDFEESRVVDMSAIEALNKLTERYAKLDKKVQLKHLSPDCLVLLKNADKLIDVDVIDDPTYKVIVDEL